MRFGRWLAIWSLALAGLAPAGFAAEPFNKQPVLRSEGAVKQTSARYAGRRFHAARQFGGRRVGFYSYSYGDVINTYGMSRSLYGSINTYRDPYVDRQTQAGPFDHGFFFDSGILPRGGDSPYMR